MDIYVVAIIVHYIRIELEFGKCWFLRRGESSIDLCLRQIFLFKLSADDRSMFPFQTLSADVEGRSKCLYLA